MTRVSFRDSGLPEGHPTVHPTVPSSGSMGESLLTQPESLSLMLKSPVFYKQTGGSSPLPPANPLL